MRMNIFVNSTGDTIVRMDMTVPEFNALKAAMIKSTEPGAAEISERLQKIVIK